VVVVAAFAVPAAAEVRPRCEVEAAVRPERASIEGAARLVPGDGACPAAGPCRLLVRLYPRRFARVPDRFDERTAWWYYPSGFDAGGIDLTSCRTASGAECVPEPSDNPEAVWIEIPAGEAPEVRLGFRVRVPERFGAFGRVDDVLVLGGGWHPLLAARGADGAPDPNAPLERTDYALRVTFAPDWELIVDGEGPWVCPAEARRGCRLERASRASEPPSLVAAPRWHERSVEAAGVRVRLLSPGPFREPATYAVRAGRGLDPASVPDLDPVDRSGWMLRRIAEALSALDEEGLLPPPERRAAEVTLIEAPLRLELTIGISGAVLVSDRAYELFPIEPFFRFQDAEVRRAVLAELERRAFPERPQAEARWTAETIAAGAVERLEQREGAAGRRAQDWLRYGAFLPVIDQMLYAPTMQFRDLYYGEVEESDASRDELWRWGTALPRGRRLWAKLRDRYGADRALEAIRVAAARSIPLATALESLGLDATGFPDNWLGDYPSLNLRLEDWSSEPREGAGWRVRVRVRCDGACEAGEFVVVRVRLEDGSVRELTWDTRSPETELAFDADAPAAAVEIDPDGRVRQDPARTDNHPRADDVSDLAWRPPVFEKIKLNLDLTTIENSEIDLDFVLRRRYDLHQFFGGRLVRDLWGVGGSVSYVYGFGPPRDLNRSTWSASGYVLVFHHFGGSGAAGSADCANPVPDGSCPGDEPVTTMEIGGFVGHDDRWFDLNPASGWYAGLRAAGAFPLDRSFDETGAAPPWFVGGAGRAFYLWSPGQYHTLALFGGFGVVYGEPTRGQLESLGNRYQLPGLEPDEALGLAKLYAGVEYRHVFTWNLDINLFHLAWLRGIQGVLFGGFGTASERASLDGLFAPERIFLDAGYGLRLFLDYAGVQTGILALDAAVPFGVLDGRFGVLGTVRGDPSDEATWRPRPRLFGLPMRVHLTFNQTF